MWIWSNKNIYFLGFWFYSVSFLFLFYSISFSFCCWIFLISQCPNFYRNICRIQKVVTFNQVKGKIVISFFFCLSNEINIFFLFVKRNLWFYWKWLYWKNSFSCYSSCTLCQFIISIYIWWKIKTRISLSYSMCYWSSK